MIRSIAYTILTEKRDNPKAIRARVCVYRARVLDTASRNASSRVSRSNILETRSKKCIVSAGRYCIWSYYCISFQIYAGSKRALLFYPAY